MFFGLWLTLSSINSNGEMGLKYGNLHKYL